MYYEIHYNFLIVFQKHRKYNLSHLRQLPIYKCIPKWDYRICAGRYIQFRKTNLKRKPLKLISKFVLFGYINVQKRVIPEPLRTSYCIKLKVLKPPFCGRPPSRAIVSGSRTGTLVNSVNNHSNADAHYSASRIEMSIVIEPGAKQNLSEHCVHIPTETN